MNWPLYLGILLWILSAQVIFGRDLDRLGARIGWSFALPMIERERLNDALAALARPCPVCHHGNHGCAPGRCLCLGRPDWPGHWSS